MKSTFKVIVLLLLAKMQFAQLPVTGLVQVKTTPTSPGSWNNAIDIGMSNSGILATTWQNTLPGTPPNHNNFVVSWVMHHAYDVSNNPMTSMDNYVYSGNLDYDGVLNPEIAVNKNTGEYIIVYWETVGSINTNSADGKVYFQKYLANGTQNGARVFVANGYFPKISMASDGTFNIAYKQWNTNGSSCSGCQNYWTMVKRYNSSCSPVGIPVYAISLLGIAYPHNDFGNSIDIQSLNGNAFYVRTGDIIRRFNTSGSQIGSNLIVNSLENSAGDVQMRVLL
jgi:hypothetical protein